jgi:hypothetical protein
MPDNRLMLFCKEADDAVLNRLGPGQDKQIDLLKKHLNRFATKGMRILVLGQAALNESIYI